MMWKNYVDDRTKFDEVNLINIIEKCFYIVGNGATILNGYSYHRPIGGLVVYLPIEELSGMDCFAYRTVYLPDYNTTIGYENSRVSSPERNICDYLMYPDLLEADFYLLDAMEGYYDEFENFDKVYEMMEKLNIPREKLDDWIPYMWEGSNKFARD